MTRISLFCPSLRGGGAEKVVVNLANGLARRGCEVDVVLVRAHGSLRDDLTSQVTVHDLRCNRVASSLLPLKRYLEQYRPEVLISFMSHTNVISIWARMISRWRPCLIITEHNNMTARRRASRRKLSTSILYFLLGYFYPYADAVVAVSQGVANDLLRYVKIDQSRLHVIYNPVIDAEVFKKAEEPVEHPWLVSKTAPVVLGVGRLTAQKDFATLLQAFALLRRRIDAKLIILGEGEERESLVRLSRQLEIAEHVDMPGFVKNPSAYMARADVFVLTSRWEGFANVLVEAMCLGTPVVSTDCPYGPSEILKGGALGRLCRVGDPQAIAQAISEVLRNPPPPIGRQEWVQYTTEYAVDRYLQLVEKLVATREIVW